MCEYFITFKNITIYKHACKIKRHQQFILQTLMFNNEICTESNRYEDMYRQVLNFTYN